MIPILIILILVDLIRYDFIDLIRGTTGKDYSYFKPSNYVSGQTVYIQASGFFSSGISLANIYHYSFYSPPVSSPDYEKADQEWVKVPNSDVTKLRNEIKNDISMWQRQSNYVIS